MRIRSSGTSSRRRRVKRLALEVDRLLDLLRAIDGVRRIRAEGIPDDARAVGVVVDRAWNTVDLYLESDEFDEVPDGEPVPAVEVIFTEFTEPSEQEPA
jgi:hypothetical protein